MYNLLANGTAVRASRPSRIITCIRAEARADLVKALDSSSSASFLPSGFLHLFPPRELPRLSLVAL